MSDPTKERLVAELAVQISAKVTETNFGAFYREATVGQDKVGYPVDEPSFRLGFNAGAYAILINHFERPDHLNSALAMLLSGLSEEESDE